MYVFKTTETSKSDYKCMAKYKFDALFSFNIFMNRWPINKIQVETHIIVIDIQLVIKVI